MSAKVSFKSMDYFKFRKYIIDANKDDPSSCSKEVTSLCSCVQTLNMRDDQFDDGEGEWARLEEVFSSYKQILNFKRVESVDVRLKSGWWGDQKSGLSVGKVKPSMLKEVLVSKCRDWNTRHNNQENSDGNIDKLIEGPGIYVFKHKEKGCFQLVNSCNDNIFFRCAELFKNTFEAFSYNPLSSLLVVSLVNDWDFYFISVEGNADLLKVIENDTILKHDSLWPHGLNMTLSIETPFDVKQFRESCVRHKWPPEKQCRQSKIQPLDAGKLKQDQKRLKSQPPSTRTPLKNISPTSPPATSRPNSARPASTVTTTIPSIQSPPLGRPSTARHHSLKSDPTNGVNTTKKETPENKKVIKAASRQETNSLKEKKPSRSNQNFKRENSLNDIQGSAKDLGKSKSETIGKHESKQNSPEGKKKLEEVSPTEKSKREVGNIDKKEESDDLGEPRPLKRSNTFTLSDNEEDKKPDEDSDLTSRAERVAKQLS